VWLGPIVPLVRSKLLCQAPGEADHPCRQPAVSGSAYCRTHRFLIEPLGSAFVTMSLTEELSLARVQIHQLLRAGAAPAEVLDALRTVTTIARLQERIGRVRRGR